MLLAEIHGKRCPDVEGLEDLFTSSVFGHLRSVPPGIFWEPVFSRAWNRDNPPSSLGERLRSLGISLSSYDSLDIDFWKNFDNYGEPDLILRFSAPDRAPIVVLVEVKLYSSKSGTGLDDQLAKYLRLVRDATITPAWSAAEHLRFVIYLTRNFAAEEIEESLESFAIDGGDARPILYGLELCDVLNVAASVANSHNSKLLSEVAQFLRVRDLDGFRGFKVDPKLQTAAGRFYQRQYFGQDRFQAKLISGGSFYGY